MKKPFQVVRITTKTPSASRKELLDKLAKTKDHLERNKVLQNAIYPNILKQVYEGKND